jgi:hypothetical protein
VPGTGTGGLLGIQKGFADGTEFTLPIGSSNEDFTIEAPVNADGNVISVDLNLADKFLFKDSQVKTITVESTDPGTVLTTITHNDDTSEEPVEDDTVKLESSDKSISIDFTKVGTDAVVDIKSDGLLKHSEITQDPTAETVNGGNYQTLNSNLVLGNYRDPATGKLKAYLVEGKTNAGNAVNLIEIADYPVDPIKEEWDASSTYEIDDVVLYEDVAYKAIQENTDSVPVVGPDWELAEVYQQAELATEGLPLCLNHNAHSDDTAETLVGDNILVNYKDSTGANKADAVPYMTKDLIGAADFLAEAEVTMDINAVQVIANRSVTVTLAGEFTTTGSTSLGVLQNAPEPNEAFLFVGVLNDQPQVFQLNGSIITKQDDSEFSENDRFYISFTYTTPEVI